MTGLPQQTLLLPMTGLPLPQQKVQKSLNQVKSVKGAVTERKKKIIPSLSTSTSHNSARRKTHSSPSWTLENPMTVQMMMSSRALHPYRRTNWSISLQRYISSYYC
jgi:hypothetical protein